MQVLRGTNLGIDYMDVITRLVLIYKQKQQMKRSPLKKTLERTRITPPKINPSNQPQTSNMYFCHYKNATYMGGIKSFKKQGRGILLHDNGISLISSYSNDLLHGHNVFFTQHCLLSAEFARNKVVECVYRTDGFMVYLCYGADGLLDGKCVLMNFVNKSLLYTVFKKGVMTSKEDESDPTIIGRVFDLNDYEFLVGRMHAQVLTYEFEKIPHIEFQKYGNKLNIGYEKNGLLNGLGFSLIFRGSHGGYNPDTQKNEDQFQLKIVERGFFVNAQLNGFGEKWFKNGNQYIGEFKNAVFEGNGVLVNNSKKNWVSGFFEKGNLIDLLEYNNEGQERKWDKTVEALHQRKTNWINNQIHLVSIQFFDEEIEKIITTNPNNQMKTLQMKKFQILKRIQQNFICQVSPKASNLRQDIYRVRRQDQTDVKKFVYSFIPEENSTKRENRGDEGTKKKQVSNLNSEKKLHHSAIRPTSRIFERDSRSMDRSIASPSRSKKLSSRRVTQDKKKIFSKTSNSPYNFNSKTKRQNELKQSPETRKIGQDSGSERFYYNQGTQSDVRDKAPLDSKRLVGKSKIFKYLHDQNEGVTPKFMYTQVDNFRENEKRQRMSINDY